MSWNAALMLLAGLPALELPSVTPFDHYNTAYRVAKQLKRPLLVVLNPADGSDGRRITYSELRSSGQCADLLDEYVVAVIDTGTEHGQKVQMVFGDKELPHVSIIDKEQKLLIFRTSDAPTADRWTEILTTHRTGKANTVKTVEVPCPT